MASRRPSSSSVRKLAARAAIASGFLLAAAALPVIAQDTDSKELSLEELEAYIAEQKEELQSVIENREVTKSKADSIQEALEAAKAREAQVKSELSVLCGQREQLVQGSGVECREENGL